MSFSIKLYICYRNYKNWPMSGATINSWPPLWTVTFVITWTRPNTVGRPFPWFMMFMISRSGSASWFTMRVIWWCILWAVSFITIMRSRPTSWMATFAFRRPYPLNYFYTLSQKNLLHPLHLFVLLMFFVFLVPPLSFASAINRV